MLEHLINMQLQGGHEAFAYRAIHSFYHGSEWSLKLKEAQKLLIALSCAINCKFSNVNSSSCRARLIVRMESNKHPDQGTDACRFACSW
jgi:hypothetical protein